MRDVVGNIPYDATEEQLIQICEEVGPVVSFRSFFAFPLIFLGNSLIFYLVKAADLIFRLWDIEGVCHVVSWKCTNRED